MSATTKQHPVPEGQSKTIYSRYHNDPLVKSLLNSYIKNLQTDLSKLETMAQDFKHKLHKLKGAATAYGYGDLAEILQEFQDQESCCADSNLKRIYAAFSKMKKGLEDIPH